MKLKIKAGIDFLMTVLLLFLMSYQITGQELHEWFGVGMLVLFILASNEPSDCLRDAEHL